MPLHKFPGYKVVRNVLDYGAKTDGSDCSDAFEKAMTEGDRCGAGCNSTSTKGAVLYIPGGTYTISRPIVMYYYTGIIGDPNDRPVIKGSRFFRGIALIDTNMYYQNVATPEGDGINWWVNQNNFYRQIRNLVLDMKAMPNSIIGGPRYKGESNLAVGIHWQVSQLCTLQNIEFRMRSRGDTRQVGIYQENGSGGFVSDLVFDGGRWCWMAGSQQYMGRNLTFKNCRWVNALVFTDTVG
jgi:hypothetical protein